MDKIEIHRVIKFLHFLIRKQTGVWFGILRIGILLMGRDIINKPIEDFLMSEQLMVGFHVTFLQNWLKWSGSNWFAEQPEVFYNGGLQ